MVGNVFFANTYEYLEDQVNLLDVDSGKSLLNHLREVRSCVLLGKLELFRESIDFLLWIGHEASCEIEVLRTNEGFKSNTKTLLSNTSICANNGFEKIACLFNLSQRPVY